MKTMQPQRVFGIGSLLLAVLFGALALYDFQTRQAAHRLAIAKQGELQHLALQNAQHGQRTQAEMLADGLANNPLLVGLVREAARRRDTPAAGQDTQLYALRRRAIEVLEPPWRAMQQHQPVQLHLYLGNNGFALLRLQDPGRFGSTMTESRPLLREVMRNGQPRSDAEIDGYGASIRAVAPIQDAAGKPIGALEVSLGLLPELVDLGERLDAGLALMINRVALTEALGYPPSGVQLGPDWLSGGHSATQALHWAQMGTLPSPAEGRVWRLLDADERTFLLNQIPLPTRAGEAGNATGPLAAALVWRDVTELVAEHARESRQLLLKWALAWLIAEALLLLLAVLLYRRIRAQLRHQLSRRQQERNRRRLLDRARKIARLLPGMVFQLKRFADGRYAFLYVSEGARAVYGLPPSSLIRDAGCALAAVHTEDLPRLRGTLLRLALQGGSASTECRIRHPERGLIWVECRASAERRRDGSVVWQGFVTEITEVMEATRALQKSESRFRAMVGNLPGAVYRCRNDGERRMRYVSEGIERLTGYPAEHFTGDGAQRYCALIHPDDRDWARLAPERGSHELTYRLRHADGSTVWVRERARLLHDRDEPLGWCDGFIWDVTAQARAEAEMLERERYLRMLIDNVIDAIVIIDEHGLVESFNHAAERIFGYRSDEIVGRNLSLLMPEPVRSAHDHYLGEYVSGAQPRVLERTRELQAQRRDGQVFSIELRVSQFSHHGQRKFIGLVRDISERKRVERMKSELVSIVSHELRTPLTSINGALGLIAGGALDTQPEQLRRMLQVAHQNSQRLARLIDDLLDMDKLVAGKMKFELKVQPLAPILAQALDSSQGHAQQQQVRLRLTAVPAVQLNVDENRLQQVLANFLSNAVKFSPAGGTVELSAGARAGWARISVSDQGPGIPDEFRARIFQKFSQADSSDTRQKGGTGLGLAICKELVERMGGRIGFESEPGRGTCFWFELPVARPPAQVSTDTTFERTAENEDERAETDPAHRG